MKTLKISQIIPDPDQPRKSFAPEKLAHLIKSIKQHGIISPLIVEPHDAKADSYLLIDGERRYRAAKELKLEEVPVEVLKDKLSKGDKLVRQFHLQEQHEGWTATEKAMALHNLCNELNVGIKQALDLLNISQTTAKAYMAFTKLVNKKAFEKSEISLEYAQPIVSTATLAKKAYSEQLEKIFSSKSVNDLEVSIIVAIKDGRIERPRDISKLKDAFWKEPKSIQQFIDDNKLSAEELFIKTKAKSAFFLRRATYMLGLIPAMIKSIMGDDVEVSHTHIADFKRADIAIQNFINKYTE